MKIKNNISAKFEMINTLEKFALNIIENKKSFFIPPSSNEVRSQNGCLCHTYHEIFFHTMGQNDISFPSSDLSMKVDDAAIIPAGTPHYEINPGPSGMKHLVVMLLPQYFSIHWGEASNGKCAYPSYTIQYNHNGNSLIDLITDQYIDSIKSKKEKLLNRGLELTLIGTLIDHLKNDSPYLENIHPKIKFIKDIINERLSDPELNVELLSGIIHCNADYLSHLFKKETSWKLNDYIKRKRMEAAREYLKNRELNISEIGWNCGYKSPSYFIATFKKFHNISPGIYRNKYI